MNNKKCIKCGKTKNLIERNAYYHGIDVEGNDLNVALGIMICVLCYDRLSRPRDKQIQILAGETKAGQMFMQMGLTEGKRPR